VPDDVGEAAEGGVVAGGGREAGGVYAAERAGVVERRGPERRPAALRQELPTPVDQLPPPGPQARRLLAAGGGAHRRPPRHPRKQVRLAASCLCDRHRVYVVLSRVCGELVISVQCWCARQGSTTYSIMLMSVVLINLSEFESENFSSFPPKILFVPILRPGHIYIFHIQSGSIIVFPSFFGHI
jgi:hypothetical protein